MSGTPIMQYDIQDTTSGLKDNHLMVSYATLLSGVFQIKLAQNSGTKGLILVKGKVHPVIGHEGSEEEWRYTRSLTLALDGGERATPHLSHLTPEKETWYPLYNRLGGPMDLSRWVWKVSPLLEINLQTAQAVVSHYTNYTTLSHS